MVKNLPARAGDTGSIAASGRSPEEGNGNPLQFPCLGDPVDQVAGGTAAHGVAESDTTQ